MSSKTKIQKTMEVLFRGYEREIVWTNDRINETFTTVLHKDDNRFTGGTIVSRKGSVRWSPPEPATFNGAPVAVSDAYVTNASFFILWVPEAKLVRAKIRRGANHKRLKKLIQPKL